MNEIMNIVEKLSSIPATLLSVNEKPFLELPSRMATLGSLYFGYFLIISGIIYDLVFEPNSQGTYTDNRVSTTILVHKLNRSNFKPSSMRDLNTC